MYFKLVMEAGHRGAGKSCDLVRYFEGNDIFGFLAKSRYIPQLKKKESGRSIKLIKEISRQGYVHGKGQERRHLCLNHSGLAARVL
jgi:hypothetical protein